MLAAPSRLRELLAGPRLVSLVAAGLVSGPLVAVGSEVELAVARVSGLDTALARLLAGWLNLLGVAAWPTGNLVAVASQAGSLWLWVDASCTGVRALLIFLLVAAVLAPRLRLSRRLGVSLLVLGVGGTLLVNVGRMLVISFVAGAWGLTSAAALHEVLEYVWFPVWSFGFWLLAARRTQPAKVCAAW